MQNRIAWLAIALSTLALIVGVFDWTQAAGLQSARASTHDSMPGMDVSTAPAGSAPAALAPEHPLDVPNVAHDPADVPAPINRTTPTTVKFTLTAKELTSEIADGASFAFWTFDGTVPGPMLRVMEGDTVELTLVNPATNKASHNIDLHAVSGPGGGASVTIVNPGESKTLTFKATKAGAYIYHCAFAPPYVHISHGMYGMIVVEPPGGLPKVDREFYVMQGEWYTTGAFGAQGHQEFSAANASDERPQYITFNGHVDALTKLHPMQAKVGEKIRLFFGDGGPNVGSNAHVIGAIFDKVYGGSPSTFVANEETTYVAPGSATVMEWRADEPGQYTLVDHALWRVAKGAAGALVVSGDFNTDLYSPATSGMSH